MNAFTTLARTPALLLLVLLAGCSRSRQVLVEIPTRDAVVTAVPDTVIRWRSPPIDTTGRRSQPLRVEQFTEADTSASVCVTSVVQTDTTLTIYTATGSQTFRSPDCGSGQVSTYVPSAPADSAHLGTEADPPAAFDVRVRGDPKPREVAVTCPACPTPVVGVGFGGWVRLAGLLLLAFVAGVVARPFLRLPVGG